MRETMFDDSYNIREVLDDVIERVTLREKLIQTAKQFAEKKREDRYTLAIKQFENLMGDFLRLYQPILDRLGSYRQGLQKELTGLKSSLATRSEEHTSELQSHSDLVCRLLLEKKKK